MNQRQPPQKHAVIPRASANGGKPYYYPWEEDDQDYDDRWPPPMPRSAINYQGYPVTTGQPPVIYSGDGKRKYTLRGAPPQVTHQPPRQTTQAQKPRPRRIHWVLPVGFVMVTMLAGFIVVSFLVNWWSTYQDDLHYGRPRTYQTDIVVGHADSASHPSHFIAINVNRHIEVIEFPGGDAAKTKIYLVSTLIGDGQDLTPVTLSFRDVNGDGKLDMVVNVQDSHYVFLNDQGQFRPARPGEAISM